MITPDLNLRRISLFIALFSGLVTRGKAILIWQV
jgi:hypothetical protein